jgi:SAM-dependent methyltransferase
MNRDAKIYVASHQGLVGSALVPSAELTQDIQRPAEMDPKERCLLCGSSLERILSGLTDTRFGTPGFYEIRQCGRCGFEQTWPVPSLADLKKLYESQYNFGGETGTLYTRLREWFFQSFLYRLWIHLDGDISFHSKSGAGRLIDIGCNEGRGLPIYSRNGFQVEGLELNANAAAVAWRIGFEVHTCLLDEFRPTALYDVAVLSNVLEHSLDPRQMLLEINRVLASGGQVWISCPNSKSWLRRVFGRSWINWHVPFHISHFSAETLRRFLNEAGFLNAEIRQITPALWVTQSFIAWIFAREGKKNRQLRNPFLTLFLLVFARFVLFSALWLGNRSGRGDCLLVVATKA